MITEGKILEKINIIQEAINDNPNISLHFKSVLEYQIDVLRSVLEIPTQDDWHFCEQCYLAHRRVECPVCHGKEEFKLIKEKKS